MASCVCGADIRWATITGTGERIPLEFRSELGPGEHRYVFEGQTTLDGVTPVSPNFTGDAYKDHRVDCPDHGNGR